LSDKIDTDQPEKRPLSFGGALAYCLANLGFGTFYSLNNAVLPLWLGQYTNNAILINLMAGVHSAEGAILQPLAGSISDHAHWKLGRRRPFLIVLVPICAFFLMAVPAVAHAVPLPLRLVALIACIVLSTTAFNLSFDPYQSMLGDITVPQQRGRVTGLWMFFGAAGQAVLLLLKMPSETKFVACAVLMLVTTAITCLATREPQHAASGAKPGLRQLWTEGLASLARLKQARIYLFTFLLYGAGSGAVLPNLTRFIEHTTGCNDESAEHLFLMLMAVNAGATLLFGLIADRMGLKRMLLLGYSLIIAASLSGLWVHTLFQDGIALSVAGLGIAAQNASSYPLLLRLIPEREIGLYTGLQTTALSIVEPLTLIIAGHISNEYGYRSIFPYCGLWVTGAIILLSQIRIEPASAQTSATT